MFPALIVAAMACSDRCPAVPEFPPRVVRWPGGSVTLDGPEVIVRQSGSGSGSSTVVSNSGNGFGNRIVVSNGGAGGTTIVRNARNGAGNRLVLDPQETVIEVPAVKPPVRFAEDGVFWTKKEWSAAYDCNLYWSAADRSWYRYHREDESYRPVTGGP